MANNIAVSPVDHHQSTGRALHGAQYIRLVIGAVDLELPARLSAQLGTKVCALPSQDPLTAMYLHLYM